VLFRFSFFHLFAIILLSFVSVCPSVLGEIIQTPRTHCFCGIFFHFQKREFWEKNSRKIHLSQNTKVERKTLLNLLNHIILLVKCIDCIHYDSGCSNCSSFHKPLFSFSVYQEGTLRKFLLSVEERFGMFSSCALRMVKPLCRPFILRMPSPQGFTEHFFLFTIPLGSITFFPLASGYVVGSEIIITSLSSQLSISKIPSHS